MKLYAQTFLLFIINKPTYGTYKQFCLFDYIYSVIIIVFIRR